ncbi:ATP-binding protein [Brevibacillus sp. NPDC003359]|uniref:ATP-binding protein n=1 Tax=unclassified Brevibacillus TaxID=2684853 RepID=UPI003674ABD0
MKQVLVNLLSNAIRYTPNEGKISIQIGNDNKQRLTLIVQDTGIGFTVPMMREQERVEGQA